MTFNIERRITEVGPLQEGWGRVIGTVRVITLECGHQKGMNPTFMYTVGRTLRCYVCEDEQTPTTCRTR